MSQNLFSPKTVNKSFYLSLHWNFLTFVLKFFSKFCVTSIFTKPFIIRHLTSDEKIKFINWNSEKKKDPWLDWPLTKSDLLPIDNKVRHQNTKKIAFSRALKRRANRLWAWTFGEFLIINAQGVEHDKAFGQNWLRHVAVTRNINLDF